MAEQMFTVHCDVCGYLIMSPSRDIVNRRLRWHHETLPSHRDISRIEEVFPVEP